MWIILSKVSELWVIFDDLFRNDNTRLSHRISYLEEQVSELQLTLQKAKDTAIITGTPNDVLTPSQPGATIIQVILVAFYHSL